MSRTIGDLKEFLNQFPEDMEYEDPEYDNCGDMCDIPLMEAKVIDGKLVF